MGSLSLAFPQAFNRAFSHYKARELVESETICQQIISAESNFFDALHLLAIVQTSLGKLNQALVSYDRALVVRPDDADVLNNRGNALKKLRRFNEALASYDQALSKRPDFAEALNNRGVTLNELGRFDEALANFDRACTLRPDFAEAFNNRGMTLFRLERLDEALEDYSSALELRPSFVDAHYNRGIVLQALRQLNEALESYDRALALQPDHAEALNNRGVCLHELKRFDEALESYARTLAIRPGHAEALNNLGITFYAQKRYDEALASYERALELAPDYTEAFNNRGATLHELKRFDEALESYDYALALRPDYAEALNNRGFALAQLGRFDDAVANYDRALLLRSEYVEALNNRGNVLHRARRHHEALTSFERALSVRPDDGHTLSNMGSVLRTLGRLDEARDCYSKALEFDPMITSTYLNYTDLVRFTPDNPHLKAMEAMRFGAASLTDSELLQLDFALAKAYADQKDYLRSFERLLSGNTLKRSQIYYDEAASLAVFERIESIFTPERLRNIESQGRGDASPVPIFIVGMPRSGTTLVEQILASHPQVHGAGELRTFSDIVHNVRLPDGRTVSYPECVSMFDAETIGKIGADYVAEVRKRAPAALRITNKQPSNYQFAGLIHLALPDAKIIHMVRDPVDTCISCFSKLFNEQNYTYDLAEMGRYYRGYQALMEHWRRVLPSGRIHEVCYEELVENFETRAQEIVEFCGLEWDDRCLTFYETERPVTTLSAIQVRQPIYKSAVDRRRLYKDFLAPLLTELGADIPTH